MSKKLQKYYSVWEALWKWIYRALALFVSFISAFHIPENIVGMTFLSVLFLFIACIIKHDVICLFDDKVEWQKKYLFGFVRVKSVYKLEDISEVHESFDNDDVHLDFFFGYGVKRSFYLVLKSGKEIEIRTYLPVQSIKKFKADVRNAIHA